MRPTRIRLVRHRREFYPHKEHKGHKESEPARSALHPGSWKNVIAASPRGLLVPFVFFVRTQMQSKPRHRVRVFPAPGMPIDCGNRTVSDPIIVVRSGPEAYPPLPGRSFERVVRAVTANRGRMKMSRMSRKSKMAALLGVLTIASSGVLAPPPALARPGCEEAQRQSCNTYMPDQGVRVWQWMGYPSLEACADEFISMNCPWQFSGPLEGVRHDRVL